MNQQKIVEEAQLFVQEELRFDSSGHDPWHIWRVTQTAKTIAKQEGANEFICELAAALHDVADEKLNESEAAGLAKVSSWLCAQNVDEQTFSHVMEIISMMSFKGGGRPPMRTLEGQVVQDADRLDAIGAIGIARVFAFSGAFGRPIYDPSIAPREHFSAKEYRNGRDTAINHFYEKLLTLKSLMNTEYGRKMAASRHQFMEDYLERFYLEWEGKS